MKDLIILGAGGSGYDVVSIVNHINNIHTTWNILGFLDDNVDLIGREIMGLKVLGNIDASCDYKNSFFVSSIAHPNNRKVRKRIYERVREAGGRFATIVHPSVTIYEDVEIGEGVIINSNCSIGTRARIHDDVHIAHGCNIGHEAVIGAHCALGGGVNLSSGVEIGEGCYIGCGVSSTHDIRVEADTLVTVGSSIVRNLRHKEGCDTFIGNPAENSNNYMRKQFVLRKLFREQKR